MKLGVWIMSLLEPALGRILASLGFSVVSIVGMDSIFQQLKSQLTTNLSGLPVDALQLFLLGGCGTTHATVDTSRGFVAGVPKALFSTGLQRNPGTSQYAVSPDGQQFLLRTDYADDKSQGFTVVLNWQRMAKTNF